MLKQWLLRVWDWDHSSLLQLKVIVVSAVTKSSLIVGGYTAPQDEIMINISSINSALDLVILADAIPMKIICISFR